MDGTALLTRTRGDISRMTVRPCVFIHTNEKQIVGALVSAYSMRRSSANADRFDVKIIHTKDHPFLHEREGQSFLRDGGQRVWSMSDLQSFTPLRFMPPELMGYEGRAVVVDPDVFAVHGDVYELLTRDMQGKAIVCRDYDGKKGFEDRFASSVMLLDCAKLTHWRTAEQFGELFEGKRDYLDWVFLKLEPRETIGLLDYEWNDFDNLTETTKFLHNTDRTTQPWKTGLPIDFIRRRSQTRFKPLKLKSWARLIRHGVLGEKNAPDTYDRHPDSRQELFFFELLGECLDEGIVTEDMLREEIGRNHVRPDAFELLDRASKSAAA